MAGVDQMIPNLDCHLWVSQGDEGVQQVFVEVYRNLTTRLARDESPYAEEDFLCSVEVLIFQSPTEATHADADKR